MVVSTPTSIAGSTGGTAWDSAWVSWSLDLHMGVGHTRGVKPLAYAGLSCCCWGFTTLFCILSSSSFRMWGQEWDWQEGHLSGKHPNKVLKMLSLGFRHC